MKLQEHNVLVTYLDAAVIEMVNGVYTFKQEPIGVAIRGFPEMSDLEIKVYDQSEKLLFNMPLDRVVEICITPC